LFIKSLINDTLFKGNFVYGRLFYSTAPATKIIRDKLGNGYTQSTREELGAITIYSKVLYLILPGGAKKHLNNIG
jgi:hypothetical protein